MPTWHLDQNGTYHRLSRSQELIAEDNVLIEDLRESMETFYTLREECRQACAEARQLTAEVQRERRRRRATHLHLVKRPQQSSEGDPND